MDAQEMAKIKIGLAEDHAVLRQGLISLLKEHKNISVSFDVSSGQELMEALKTSQPHIVLLDIQMPVMNGIEALKQITLNYPDIQVIMLSNFFNLAHIVECVRAGAKALLPKEATINKITEAIASVYTVGHYYDEKVTEFMRKEIFNPVLKSRETSKIKLTKREDEILKLIQPNKTSQEIADIFNVSTRTIEWHRSNLKKKTEGKTSV